MRTCPGCGRRYPEVVGAEEQRCPHCGHVTSTPAPAPRRPDAPIADPVGALAHAGRFVARHYPRLLLLWLPVIVADVAASWALVAYQRRHGIEDLARITPDQALPVLGVALPVYFLDFAVTLAAWAVVAAHVLDPEGRRPGGLRRDLLKGIPAALAVGALLTLALLAGFVLLVVPFLVLFHMFLFAPAAHAAGARVGEAFDRSRRFAKERATYGFTALMILAAALVAGLVTVLAGALQDAAAGAGVRSDYALALLGVLPAWLLSPLLPVLPASYWRLAEEADRADASGTPAPRAETAAEERSRTTKCPRCGTLIDYEPTGQPVQVRCPSCGTSGRVL